MKIYRTDSPEVVCAKKAAMICMYAIRNPLHVFFEDGNVHRAPMSFERDCNDQYREQNGRLMYEFVREFLNEFEEIPLHMRWDVYKLYRKKAEYLDRKWSRKIRQNSPESMQTRGSSMIYKHYLGEDGHIYVKTVTGVELRQF